LTVGHGIVTGRGGTIIVSAITGGSGGVILGSSKCFFLAKGGTFGFRIDVDPLITDRRDLDESKVLSEKIQRLIDWNTEKLICLLKQILARRTTSRFSSNREVRLSCLEKIHSHHPLEEVQEIISLPEYDAAAIIDQRKNHTKC
jgi:hypothetical protein